MPRGIWTIGYDKIGRYIYKGVEYQWRYDVIKEVMIMFKGITPVANFKCSRLEKDEKATNTYMQRYIEQWVADEEQGKHGYHIVYDD